MRCTFGAACALHVDPFTTSICTYFIAILKLCRNLFLRTLPFSHFTAASRPLDQCASVSCDFAHAVYWLATLITAQRDGVPRPYVRAASGARHFQMDISQQPSIGSTSGLLRGQGNKNRRIHWSRDRWRHVTPKIKVVTPISLRPRISITVQDRRAMSTNRKPSAPATRPQQLSVSLRVLHGLDSTSENFHSRGSPSGTESSPFIVSVIRPSQPRAPTFKRAFFTLR